jgi:5-methylcytosine-specific restriction endonuclease McrA
MLGIIPDRRCADGQNFVNRVFAHRRRDVEPRPAKLTAMAPRRFGSGARVAVFLAAQGRCAECGAELDPGWHADHVQPVRTGGATLPANGQALCPRCNLVKGGRPA